MAFADLLMADPFLEAKAVAIELVARYRRALTPAWLPRWKRWLSSNQSANWATTDALCGLLIGPMLLGILAWPVTCARGLGTGISGFAARRSCR